ncbi:MAG: class I SAM-dependent methyltransferase [Caldilineaceae bacterium]
MDHHHLLENSPALNRPARSIHQETGAAWEVVAQAGYSGEIEQDVEFIRKGGISLLAPEQRLLQGLEQWCDCALQLQCSGGRDLLSLWNLGAKQVIGVDISATLIDYARQKSTALNAPATWYCCDLLETPQALNGVADLIYTGRGALMWMVDLNAWAQVVARLLRPHGRIVIYEGHPLDNLWDRDAETFVLRDDGSTYFPVAPSENPGFPSSVVIRETANSQARPRMMERHWQPSEVINALTAAGLTYVHFAEYPDLFWNQFPNIPAQTAIRLPHTYSVVMQKTQKGPAQ